jgi:hypothetical protein
MALRVRVPRVAPAGVPGTLAATETGADTLAASGVVLVAGTMAVTEAGADTLAASGGVLVKGALAVTEAGADTLEASASSPIIGALATITAGGTLSGNIVAALQAAAALAGAGSVTAAVDALAWAVAAANGSASLSATPFATGQLDAAIVVGATEGLTAAQVAEQVLDSELVEIGLTVRGALRLIAAASAGEVAISGDTVTIRSAVADSKNRIVATTDAQGQRTAITFDLTDG